MPAKEYPHKRPRTEAPNKGKKYANAAEIRFALRADNQESLTEALTTLRGQFAIKSTDEKIAPQDERLELVKQWMQSSPGAHDLFAVWDSATLRQSSLISLVVSVLSSVLTLLSTHYTDHALGQPIMKTLLVPSRLRQLNSYLGGSNNELIIVVLKLYNVMSNFAGGHDRKAILEGFGWEIKSLPKLLNMRRKAHGENDTTDPLSRPDIRTLYILFLLSFVDTGSSSQIKTAFLEQHREVFLAIFKGLVHDHYSLARKILEVCWTGIWSDAKIKRTLKVGLFNETTLGHLFKLYDRTQSDDDDEDHIPADLMHHFLLAICTRPGVGICFKDRGWYPREMEGDDFLQKEEEETARKGGKIYNKILANILKTLKVNEDSRQQELAIKILSACPELVAGYWSAAALTLEPRLSSKWLANIAVFGIIISLPIPSSMFYMSNSQLYQPTPPPLSTVIENVLPSVGTKTNFSKGLQSASGLVQHSTALALARCLVKYHNVWDQFRKIAAALEENEEDGQWNKRCRELEREVRRRVPEFQVIIGFSQQKHTGPLNQVNSTKIALLAEVAQRLLWLYHRCLPAVVAEARFDVGKLLLAFSQDAQMEAQNEVEDNDESLNTASRLYRVQKLHVLSLLKDSDQFVWTGKIATLSHTPFRILLTSLISIPVPAIRSAIATLLQHILSHSILFQEDPKEPDLWLKALPKYHVTLTEADTTLFQGETEGLIAFLDDCVQRCLKTPYRYVEALHSDPNITGTNDHRLDMYPSPLLMTIMEQLDAKMNNKSLAPSHLLGVISFIRKILVNLASKTSDLRFLRAYAHRLDEMLLMERLSQASPTFFTSIRREVDILYASLSFSSFAPPITTSSTPEMEGYLALAERTPIPTSKRLRTVAASQLVDWLRTLNQPLTPVDLKRLVAVVTSLDSSMLPFLLKNLIPGQTDVWSALDLASKISEYRRSLTFAWLYTHSGLNEIIDQQCQIALVDSLFMQSPALIEIIRAIYLVIHRISTARQEDAALKGHLTLLARLITASKSILSSTDLNALKEIIFVQPNALKDLLMAPTPSDVFEGTKLLLSAAIEPSSKDDRKIVFGIGDYWFNILRTGLDNQPPVSVDTACAWVKYLESDRLFDLLDFLEKDSRNALKASAMPPINAVLDALRNTSAFESQAEQALVHRLPQLLSLKSVLSDSSLLEQVIVIAVEALLPVSLDGRPPVSTSGPLDLITVVKRAESRWARRNQAVGVGIDIRTFLMQDAFSDSTAKIISCLLYRQPSSHQALVDWLNSESLLKHDVRYLVPIFYAFFDSSTPGRMATSSVKTDVWLPFMSKIVQMIADVNVPPDIRMRAHDSLISILSASATDRSKLLDAVAMEMKSVSRSLSHELLSTGIKLASKFGSKADSIISHLVDHGLQWCIDQFARGQDITGWETLIRDLAVLIRASSITKAHLVETLLTVIIQNQLSNVDALHLAVSCLATAQLKPLIVNRHLQSILQHVQFFKLCSSSSPDHSSICDAIIELLHCLFKLHPHNTCQISHIEPLIRVYRGTLSRPDIRILSVFQLFETQRRLSATALISQWSSTPNTSSQTPLEALQSLDPVVVLRTCLNFPRWRQLDDQSGRIVDATEAALYDPVFLMLLFSQMLADQSPTSAFGWIELFRTNVVSLFIRALSSKEGEIRDLALCQIVGLWKLMETADLQERPHVLYILNLLKDLLPAPSNNAAEYPSRLPTYTTLLLMHALRAIFNPSSFIYPVTARFLLQRPSLDTADVPMLYNLLYSSSDDHWKKERGWMIKFLADGMVGSEDWRALKRRHTWDLLASLFQSADGSESTPLRMGILEVLAHLTCNAQAATSLILKSALLPWVEMQLAQPTSNSEGVEWIKILENILLIVDSKKVEVSTNGEWRAVICRCLGSLLDDKYPSAIENFPHAVPVILRLALLDGPVLRDLPSLLDLAVRCLKQLESTVKPDLQSLSLAISDGPVFISSTPHRSLTIHQRLKKPFSTSVQRELLMSITQMLWRASMTLDRECAAWEKLSPRILLWRSVGLVQEVCPNLVTSAGEWARKEAVENLHQIAY